MSSKKSKPQNPNPDYQDRDIKLKPLLVGLAVMVVVLVLAFVGMSGLLSFFKADAAKTYEPASELTAERTLPGGPLLQVVPKEELAAHRAVEQLFLHQYQWLDREAGVARIPIDRAMAILVDRGMPVREADDE